jgi:glycosyltransferase involved in cell wall biosynthesis
VEGAAGGSVAGQRVDILYGLHYAPDPRVRRTGLALASTGRKVRIVAWDRSGNRRRRETDGPMLVERIRVATRNEKGPSDLIALVRFAAAMLPLLRRDRPDVLHAVDLPMLIVALTLRPLLLPHRPTLVYDAFEIYERMIAHRYPRYVRAAIAFAERFLPRLADLVITPGSIRSTYLADRGVSSLVVPNWIDPIAELPDRARSRQQLDVDDRTTIGYTGLLGSARDLDSLLDHARRHSDHLVVIAGAGDDEGIVRRAAEELENVRFAGWVSDPTQILAAVDMLYYGLKPSHPYAPLVAPNNLYVAIAAAIPLVYRPQGELATVGCELDIGEAFTDAASLDAAIEKLGNPIRNSEVRAGLSDVRASYTWAAAVRPLLAVYPRNGRAINAPRTNGA